MFIVIQFPLADSRPFIDYETHRLNIPTWPLARPDEEFVRYAGPVKKRQKGGIKDWSGEDLYSRANRAIRLPELGIKKLGNKDTILSPQCAFRRLFSNGEAVVRIELAFRTKRDWYYSDENSLLTVIENCLALPVAVPLPDIKIAPCELHLAGSHLARLYLLASTNTSNQKDSPIKNWWVKDGRPLVFIESKEHDYDAIPKIAHSIEESIDYEIDLSHFWMNRKGKLIRVWLIGYSGYSNFDTVRRLRLNLLRLHAEQECLKEILRLLGEPKITVKHGTDASNRLQQYLNQATKVILKKERYGLPQSKFLDSALDYEDIVNEGERTTLLSQLEKIRPTIFRKIEKYTTHKDSLEKNIIFIHKPSGDVSIVDGKMEKIGVETMTKISVTLGDGTVFHGDFVVAKNIEESFNKAQESQVVEELRMKLKELSSLTAKLCEQLPEEKAEEVARDLHSFVNEATSKKPRKKWYELSAKGLVEAAKTVATVAGPIVTTVKTILSLLG